MSLCQVGKGPCAEWQINLIKVDGNKKLGEWSASVKRTDRKIPVKRMVAGVWWLSKESQAKDVIKEYFQ